MNFHLRFAQTGHMLKICPSAMSAIVELVLETDWTNTGIAKARKFKVK